MTLTTANRPIARALLALRARGELTGEDAVLRVIREHQPACGLPFEDIEQLRALIRRLACCHRPESAQALARELELELEPLPGA